MATESIVGGLFGMTPQAYEAEQQALADREALQYARLKPFERVAYGAYGAGQQLGRGLGGLMGVEDPQLKVISARNAVLGEVDQTNPRSILSAAVKLQQIDPQGASQLMTLARQVDAANTERLVKESQIVRNLRERPASSSELSKLQAERADLIAEFGENDPRVKEINALIAKKTEAGGGIGAEIAAGLSPLVGAMAGAQAKKAGETGGGEVGKQVASIQGKYTALGSIKDAIDMLDKGIYSGGYGPMQEAAAKYAGGLIRKDRLANTQEFRAYIGDVVIPRLQEFGGNDSVEELNYLRSVMAGDTSLEGTALKNILKRADSKIRSGISRLEEQQKAITTGKPLPIGDTSAAPAQRIRTYNPTTGKLE